MRSRDKYFDRYGNSFRVTGRKALPIETVGKSKKYSGHSGIDPDTIDLQSLLKHHLCKGEHSECVSKGTCECLEICRFGQRYVALTTSAEKQ